MLAGERRDPLVAQQADDLVVLGQPGPGDAGRDHVRVGEDRCPASRAPRAAGHEAGVDDEVAHEVGLAGAVDHPHGDLLGVGRHAGQVALGADRRERVDVDRRAVVDVLVVDAGGEAGGQVTASSRSGSTMLRHGVTTISRPARASSWSRRGRG